MLPVADLWKSITIDAAPHVLPGDAEILQSKPGLTVCYDNETYLAEGLARKSDTRFHVGLLPQPYHGDLARASVFLLMLNPGLGPADYFSEFCVPEYRRALVDNLLQSQGRRFPLIFLDPSFAWHSGARFFRGKLNWLVHDLAHQRGLAYLEALSVAASSICCLELVPYHSTSFKADRLLKELPSVQAIKQFAIETLEERRETLFIVTRQISQWGLLPSDRVVAYGSSESRAAHLSRDTAGGKALLQHFQLK